MIRVGWLADVFGVGIFAFVVSCPYLRVCSSVFGISCLYLRVRTIVLGPSCWDFRVYCRLLYFCVYGLLLPYSLSPTFHSTPSPHHPHHTNPHRSHPHATTHSTNIVSYPAIYARNHTLQSYTIPAAEIPTTYSSTLVICTL